jgi:acetamidase/formamidase
MIDVADRDRALRLLDNLGVEPHYGALVCTEGAFRDIRVEIASAYQRAGGVCNRTLDCGSRCYLPTKHDGACMCVGDTDGPGSCPA